MSFLSVLITPWAHGYKVRRYCCLLTPSESLSSLSHLLFLLYVAHSFRTSLNSSRPDSSSVCLGWDRCCTPSDSLCLWPLDIKFLEIVALSLHHFLRTTSNSSRLDSSSACLGWDRCCTLLPSSCAFDPVDIVDIADLLLLRRHCRFPPRPPRSGPLEPTRCLHLYGAWSITYLHASS